MIPDRKNQRGDALPPLNILGCLALYVPWVLATGVAGSDILSWWLAWLGSLWIFFLVWRGFAGRVNTDIPFGRQVLKPVFLLHAVFAGYGFVTSIFYYLDLNGISPLDVQFAGYYPGETMARLAQAQRYYVLAHASFAVGLLATMRGQPKQYWAPPSGASTASVLLSTAALGAFGGYVTGLIPALKQFDVKFWALASVAGSMCIGPALVGRGRPLLGIALVLDVLLFFFALASGWKENAFVLVILIGMSIYPMYPRSARAFIVASSLLGFLTLPTISVAVRDVAWDIGGSKTEAVQAGIEALAGLTTEQLQTNTWDFFVRRLSEVGMFVRFIESVETSGFREGSEILLQAATAPIPRAIWPGKPNIEDLVMRRVVGHGIVEASYTVSAKTHPIVDGYLVGGGVGVLFSFLVIGAVAGLGYDVCETLLGGYLLGGVFFNALFSILWRGNCFEFMSNAVVWSFVIVFLLHHVGRSLGWLVPVPREPRPSPRPGIRTRQPRHPRIPAARPG